MKDIHTNISPVLNLSNLSIEESFLLACDYPLTKILLEDFTPQLWPIELPIIIDWLEEITNRWTVSKAQYSLLSDLYDLLSCVPSFRV